MPTTTDPTPRPDPGPDPLHRYADTSRCPACRAPLAPSDIGPQARRPERCPRCDVPLGHPVVPWLFAALSEADRLVGELRRASAPAPAVTRVPAVARVPAPGPDAILWRGAEAATARTGVRGSRVPGVLLGLGALCLLVAAVTFLAVAWSWLGVGGRTAVLLALSVVAAGGSLVALRRGLRVSAEALSCVALGTTALDVVGARSAGWLGAPTDAGLTVLVALVVAGAAAVLALGSGRAGLVAPQLVGTAAAYVATLALPEVSSLPAAGHPVVVAALATAGFTLLARSPLRPTSVVAAVAAGLSWLGLLGHSVVALTLPLTAAGLWDSAAGPGLTTAALLLLAPVAVTRAPVVVALAAAASTTALTAVAALPVLDEGATELAAGSLVAAGLWCAAAAATRALVRRTLLVPASVAALPALGLALVLGGRAVATALDPTASALRPATDPVVDPVLLPLAALLLAGLVVTAAPAAWRRTVATVALAGPLGLSLALLPAPYLAPSPVLVASLTLLGALYAATAATPRDRAGLGVLAAGVAVLLLAVAAAQPSSAVVLLPTATLTMAATITMLRGRFEAATQVGGLLLAPAVAGLVWTAAEVAGVDTAWRAVPVLLVLAAIVLPRPRVGLEPSAVLSVLVAALVAVPAAADQPLSLALHLTLAGVAVTLHALLHAERRRLAWAGATLLAAATWVRLLDTGVEVVEAYTLPSALVLLAVAGLRLRAERSRPSRDLAPGLALAVVPSLLVALDDPVSLRALLVGLVCLVLVLGGALARLGTPLLLGAAAGSLLVLSELAPYLRETPQWVVIGLAGAVLLVVGTTWESRVGDARLAARYVARLR